MSFLNIILPYTLQIVSALVIAAIGVAGTWATAKFAQGKHLDNIASAMDMVTTAAQSTVGELNQTVVEAMKAGNGKLTQEQKAHLGSELLNMTKQKLAAPVVNLLAATQTDVDAVIQGAAESHLDNLKRQSPLLEDILAEFRV